MTTTIPTALGSVIRSKLTGMTLVRLRTGLQCLVARPGLLAPNPENAHRVQAQVRQGERAYGHSPWVLEGQQSRSEAVDA